MIGLSALCVVLALVMSQNAFEASLVAEWSEFGASTAIATVLLAGANIIMEVRK